MTTVAGEEAGGGLERSHPFTFFCFPREPQKVTIPGGVSQVLKTHLRASVITCVSKSDRGKRAGQGDSHVQKSQCLA